MNTGGFLRSENKREQSDVRRRVLLFHTKNRPQTGLSVKEERAEMT